MPEPPEYSRARVAVNAYLQGEDLAAKGLTGVVIPWPPAEGQVALYTNASRESPVAYEACIMFVERFTEYHQPIPRELASWIRAIAYGRITRPASTGRSKHDNSNRDAAIREAVRIAEEYGLKGFRSGNSKPPHHSGCDLVGECLEGFNIYLAYSGIAEIWKKRKKQSRPLM